MDICPCQTHFQTNKVSSETFIYSKCFLSFDSSDLLSESWKSFILELYLNATVFPSWRPLPKYNAWTAGFLKHHRMFVSEGWLPNIFWSLIIVGLANRPYFFRSAFGNKISIKTSSYFSYILSVTPQSYKKKSLILRRWDYFTQWYCFFLWISVNLSLKYFRIYLNNCFVKC